MSELVSASDVHPEVVHFSCGESPTVLKKPKRLMETASHAMRLFRIQGLKLDPVKETGIDLESRIQKVVEGNLDALFGLEFVRSEFPVHGSRIDTLAFDKVTKSFAIIEYKREKSFSVVDQGVSYLAIMLDNKADFVLEYMERNPASKLKREDIDWSQSRVIFVADSFNEYQVGAIGFRGLPIELWEAKLFEQGILSLDQVKPLTENREAGGLMKKATKELEKVTKEVKTYDLEYHFKGWDQSRELYEAVRQQVHGLGLIIVERFTKFYIAFIDETMGKSFAEVVPQKKGLKIYLRPSVEHFPSSPLKVVDCTTVGHWTNGNSRFDLQGEKTSPMPSV